MTTTRAAAESAPSRARHHPSIRGGTPPRQVPLSSAAGHGLESLLAAERALPMAAVERLADLGYLRPADWSPLADLRPAGGEPPVPLAGDLPPSGGVARALAVLARPATRLRLALGAPGRPSRVHHLYVGGGSAVACRRDSTALAFSRPLPLATLRAALVGRLRSAPPPPAMDAFCLLPEIFEVLSALWRRRRRRPAVPVPLAEIDGLLDGAAPGAAPRLVAALENAGAVRLDGGELHLAETYRRWLAPVWSGHVVEMERTPLAPGACAGAGTDWLLFAGPPDDRVLCEDLPYPAAAAERDEPQPGGSLCLFRRLTAAKLEERLERLLSPERSRAELTPAERRPSVSPAQAPCG